MNNSYFNEVLAVLKHYHADLISIIPENFIKFLNDNKDETYVVNIDFSKINWEDTLQDEAKSLLALIYRDFLISPEERKVLLQQEYQERVEQKKEAQKKYNPDYLFKKKDSNLS